MMSDTSDKDRRSLYHQEREKGVQPAFQCESSDKDRRSPSTMKNVKGIKRRSRPKEVKTSDLPGTLRDQTRLPDQFNFEWMF